MTIQSCQQYFSFRIDRKIGNSQMAKLHFLDHAKIPENKRAYAHHISAVSIAVILHLLYNVGRGHDESREREVAMETIGLQVESLLGRQNVSLSDNMNGV